RYRLVRAKRFARSAGKVPTKLVKAYIEQGSFALRLSAPAASALFLIRDACKLARPSAGCSCSESDRGGIAYPVRRAGTAVDRTGLHRGRPPVCEGR